MYIVGVLMMKLIIIFTLKARKCWIKISMITLTSNLGMSNLKWIPIGYFIHMFGTNWYDQSVFSTQKWMKNHKSDDLDLWPWTRNQPFRINIQDILHQRARFCRFTSRKYSNVEHLNCKGIHKEKNQWPRVTLTFEIHR